MFGWTFLRHTTSARRRTYGIDRWIDRFGRSTWLTLHFGRHSWRFLRDRPSHFLRERYGMKDKPTGWNRAVLGWFFRGPERRQPGSAYIEGVKASMAKPPLTAAEIRKRNREAIASGKFKPWPSFNTLQP